jgi:hypothetical protein
MIGHTVETLSPQKAPPLRASPRAPERTAEIALSSVGPVALSRRSPTRHG